MDGQADVCSRQGSLGDVDESAVLEPASERDGEVGQSTTEGAIRCMLSRVVGLDATKPRGKFLQRFPTLFDRCHQGLRSSSHTPGCFAKDCLEPTNGPTLSQRAGTSRSVSASNEVR